jgi:glutamine synthetase
MAKALSGEDILQQFLQNCRSVKYIRLQWSDFSGVLRTRFLPVKRCLSIARGEEEYLLPQISMIIPVSTDPKCFPTTDAVETWVLEPDWSSLRRCGFWQHHGSAMCFVRHKEAQDPYGKCPRMLLCRALGQFERDWGAKALAGFEIEFMLLEGRNAQQLDQLDRLNSYQTTAGLRGQTLDILEEVLDDLDKSSIGIHHFHTETHDQIEIALSPESPLQAIDSFILAQETIRTVFVRHGIKATMTPKPLINGTTNGIHMHLSVDKLAPPQTDHFLASILNHMSSLCAFGMANFDSYVRTGKEARSHW